MSTWFPSLVQNTEGGGLPFAMQSNFAIPLIGTRISFGITVNVGRAIIRRENQMNEIDC